MPKIPKKPRRTQRQKATDDFVAAVYEDAIEWWFESLMRGEEIFPKDTDKANNAAELEFVVRLTRAAACPPYFDEPVDPVLAMWSILTKWDDESDSPVGINDVHHYTTSAGEDLVSATGLERMGWSYERIKATFPNPHTRIMTGDGPRDLYAVAQIRQLSLTA